MPAKNSTAQKKLPAADTGPQLQCLTTAGDHYIVSQNPMTGKFTLWKVIDSGYQKVAVADSPTPLNEKIPW